MNAFLIENLDEIPLHNFLLSLSNLSEELNFLRSIHQAKSQPLVGQSQLECLQSLGNS